MQAQHFLGQLALNPTGGKTPTDGAIPVDAKIGGIRGDFTFRGGQADRMLGSPCKDETET